MMSIKVYTYKQKRQSTVSELWTLTIPHISLQKSQIIMTYYYNDLHHIWESEWENEKSATIHIFIVK